MLLFYKAIFVNLIFTLINNCHVLWNSALQIKENNCESQQRRKHIVSHRVNREFAARNSGAVTDAGNRCYTWKNKNQLKEIANINIRAHIRSQPGVDAQYNCAHN